MAHHLTGSEHLLRDENDTRGLKRERKRRGETLKTGPAGWGEATLKIGVGLGSLLKLRGLMEDWQVRRVKESCSVEICPR